MSDRFVPPHPPRRPRPVHTLRGLFGERARTAVYGWSELAFSAWHIERNVLGHRVHVVQRGALVALKFHAAVSHTRRIGDRYIDVGDIDRIMRAKFDAEDRALALRIAETMYPGASDELAQLLDDLQHNRPVRI